MKALLLAGGFSTRLYPITQYFPKGLLPIAGKPITQYIVDEVIFQKEIDAFAVVTNDRYFQMFTYWKDTTYPDKKIPVLNNAVKTPEARLGSIGDLLLTIDTLKWDDDVLVLSSDTLTSLQVPELLTKFNKLHEPIACLYEAKDRSLIRNRLGCAMVDGDVIVDFVEKPEDPPSNWMAVPYYIFPKESILLIREYKKTGNSMDAPGSFISWLVKKTTVRSYPISGFYYDIGTIDVYNDLSTHPPDFSLPSL